MKDKMSVYARALLADKYRREARRFLMNQSLSGYHAALKIAKEIETGKRDLVNGIWIYNED